MRTKTIDRERSRTHLSKGITPLATIRVQPVRIARNQLGERWSLPRVSRVGYAVGRLIAVSRLASPVATFVNVAPAPLVEFFGLIIAPGRRSGDLLRLPGPVVQLVRFSLPTPCEGVVQPLVPLLPLSIETVIQIFHLLQLSTVLCSEDILPPHRYNLLADIRLIWCDRELRKSASEQPFRISLTDRPGPRVCSGAPVLSLVVDDGWTDRSRFLLWLAPRFASTVVPGIGVRRGIFLRLHGLAMREDCTGARWRASGASLNGIANPWSTEFGPSHGSDQVTRRQNSHHAPARIIDQPGRVKYGGNSKENAKLGRV